MSEIQLNPIGYVQKDEEKTWIEIEENYTPALLNLDLFSHLITLWWIDQRDNAENRKILQVTPKVKTDEVETPLCGVYWSKKWNHQSYPQIPRER